MIVLELKIKMNRLTIMETQNMNNIKLLSIGNSFSTDAQKWLHQIAETAGADIYCANLYIGGCSLQQHWNNYLTQENVYDYEVNGFFKKRFPYRRL